MQRNEEQNGRVQLPTPDRTQPLEMTCEIALPDYRSEISRLLWVRPTLLPPARFIGNGKIEFSGPVCYHILYVGPDGALYGAEHEGSYAFSLARDAMDAADGADELETAVELVPDAVISRVVGPRKLSVCCRASARVCCYAAKNVTPCFRGEGADADSIHRLCDAIENGCFTAGDCERFQLEDQIEGESRELRLISCDGSLFVTESVALEGAVRCRGEVLVRLLCCEEGGEGELPFVLTKRIPFERELPLAGVTPDWRVCVAGALQEVTANVEENHRISITVSVFAVAEGQNEESVLLYRDAYLPGFDSECRMSEERFWRAGFCGNRNFSVSGERALAEIGIPADATILHVEADAELREQRHEQERTLLPGDLRCHVLYHCGGEYAAGEFSIPFRGILDENSDEVSGNCHVISCRVTPVGDSLRVDAEIGLALRAMSRATASRLAEVSFSPCEPTPRAALEICYPDLDDSLWSVGKRYGISPDALAVANGLSADAVGDPASLGGVKYLLIPQK